MPEVKQSIGIYKSDWLKAKSIKLKFQEEGEVKYLPDIIHEALVLYVASRETAKGDK